MNSMGKESGFLAGLSRRDRRRFGLPKTGNAVRPPASPLLVEETFPPPTGNPDGKSARYSVYRREWRSDIATEEYLTSLAGATSALKSLMDQDIPPGDKTERFWGSISSSSTGVAAGVEALAVSLESSSKNQAAPMLDEVIKSKIPNLLKGKSRNEKRVINTRLLQTIVSVFHLLQPKNAIVQERLGVLLGRVLAGWNTEEQIILLGNAFTHLSERRKISGVDNATEVIPGSNHYNPRMSAFIQNLAVSLEGHIVDPKDETDLRLAVVGYFFVGTVINSGHAGRLIRLDLRERSRNYLNKFFEGSRRSPENMLEALGVVTQALKKASSVTKATISLLLSGEINWQNVLANEAGGENLGRELRNFSPLLKGVFALLEKDEYRHLASDTLKELLEGAMAETEDGTTGNHLLSQIVASPNFADQQKLFIIRTFLSCMGYETNSEVSDAELLHIFTRGDWRLEMNGREVTEARNRLSVAHRVRIPALPVEPPANSGLPKVAVVFDEAEIIEASAPTEPTPAQPAEPRQLTEEERIVGVLEKVFPVRLTDEDIKILETRSRELWGEIDLRNQKRNASFDPDGTAVMLRLDRVKKVDDASPNGYPRIVFQRQQLNGSLSDIAGTIFLTSEVILPFAINNQGELEGRPEALFVDGTISYENYLQLQHAVISLAHKLLRRTDKELAERAVHARQHVEGEIAVGGRVVKERLQQALDASLAFLVQVVYPGLADGNEVNIDLQKVREALKGGQPSVSVYYPINSTVMEDLRHQAKNGQANLNPSGGRLVLLPKGYQPSRRAMDNAERFGMSIVQVTVFNLNEAGLLEWVTFLTTFRSFPERKTHAA